MGQVSKFCRCDNQQRFSGGCSVCNPIGIKCSWDDKLFTIAQSLDGTTTGITLTNTEAQYLLEQLILRFQPWKGAS